MQEISKPIWGKLMPLSRGHGTYALRQPQVIIGRNSQCQVIIADKRLSGKHCIISVEDRQIFITDTSTNGTYINNQRIKKSVKIEIYNETEIWFLPTFKVSQEESIGFRLKLLGDFLNECMMKIEQRKEKIDDTTAKFSTSIKENITCPFCCDIMVLPVSIQPCNHRLCGPCLTHLVQKNKDTCIVCRKKMITAAKDPSFNEIIDNFLRAHPKEIRRDEDQEVNIFGHQPKNIENIINGKEGQQPDKKVQMVQQHQPEPMDEEKELLQGIQILQQNEKTEEKDKTNKRTPQKKQIRQKRTTRSRPKKSNRFLSSDISASTDSNPHKGQMMSLICKECTQQRKGFKCEPDQLHVKCHNCSKPFAKREDEKLYQNCALCHSYFCTIYFPPCQKNGPKLILLGNRGPTCQISPLFLRNNKVEMDAVKNLLVSQKKKVIDMFNEMLSLIQSGKFQFTYDKRLMRSAPNDEKSVRIHKRSPICDNCWRQLWFQMIFMYVKENSYMMPETIKNRPPCYWGVNCRTMQHNIEHCKKYRHMEYQSRF